MRNLTRSKLRRDAAVVAGVLLVVYVAGCFLQLHEWIDVALARWESVEADEFMVALAVLPLALIAVLTLRWCDLRRALTRSLLSERALQQSEHRYRALFDNATAGISRWSRDGELLIGNAAFTAMLGGGLLPPGLRLADLMSEEAFQELRRVVASDGRVGPTDMEWWIGKREVCVRLAATLATDAGPGELDLITQDVTHERGLETQLRHAQKMDAVGRLAGGIAHDFNNLLTVILDEAELARDELPTDAPTQNALANVVRAAGRATILTRQLLTFSRRDVVRPDVFDIGEAVNDMARMLRRLIGEQVRLGIRINSGTGTVFADRAQVEQVVLNLVVNARDAMPDGGSLIIETGSRRLDESHAALHPGVVAGEYVVISVSDSGIGMSQEIKERLFEPFFTTKRLGEGTGLGLATSYGIVKQAGGHIGVYSETGMGTTMRVYLPRTYRLARAHGESERLPPPMQRHETVLVVEDEPGVRQIAARVLQRQGYRVLEAANGFEALRLLQTMPYPVDLVISDVVMPEMGGRELVERVRKTAPGVRVMLMSGYTDDMVLKQRLVDRSVPFLQKPFTVTEFAHAVETVLRNEPIATGEAVTVA